MQNLWVTAKAVLREKFTVTKYYLKKQEISQINNVNIHLKQLEEERRKPNVSRRKKIIKIKVNNEINEVEMKKIIAKISKSWFFEKNELGKCLVRLFKKKQEKTQINKIRNEKGEFTIVATEIQKIISDYYEHFIL